MMKSTVQYSNFAEIVSCGPPSNRGRWAVVLPVRHPRLGFASNCKAAFALPLVLQVNCPTYVVQLPVAFPLAPPSPAPRAPPLPCPHAPLLLSLKFSILLHPPCSLRLTPLLCAPQCPSLLHSDSVLRHVSFSNLLSPLPAMVH